ncbi:bacterial Ig-like domain-containing protein [Paenibacillus chartarius]|uniref:Bacterial Ig-like domain-containing protein n=1 Tax=Paenibacillus chartarius TaxID=747481 RepID=A0ABV6DGH4_9BACL
MKEMKRSLGLLLSFMLVFSSLGITAAAEEADPTAGMISISSDWQGSVFGDVGGQDKITSTNFAITENPDNTVTLRSSNNRGKVVTSTTSSPTEGIAYYYKQIPDDANFEMTATASVKSYAADNQVSFGIMARSMVYTNVSGATYASGDYVAAGAIDQKMQSFRKLNNAVTKEEFTGVETPAADKQYQLSIKRTGSNFAVKIGDEVKTVDTVTGITYVGLYTARNTEVKFSNVNLTIEQPINLGEWKFGAFGNSTDTSTDPAKNPNPVIAADGSVRLTATGGKIDSSGKMGISYYFKELPAGTNFEISAKAKVNSFNSNTGISTPGQKSFGLMVMDDVGQHGSTDGHVTNFVGIGGFGGTPNVMKTAMKAAGAYSTNAISGVNAPAANEQYDLRIRKIGQVYLLTANGVTQKLVPDQLVSDTFYAGLYAARDADITFSDIRITADPRMPASLTADTSLMKTTYLIGEELDLSALKLTAVYPNGAQETISAADYAVTGFDSGTEGTKTVTLHFNGVVATIQVNVIALTVVNLQTKYLPAKTVYYPGDALDLQGLVLTADYNNHTTAELTPDKYSLSVEGAAWNGTSYVLDTPGTKRVTVTSTETPSKSASFTITVKDALIEGIEVRQQPKKTLYFLNEELNLEGMVVYAKYSDQGEVRLMKQDYTVSALDTTTAGAKQVTLAHKGKTATLALTVKAKEATGVQVTKYPITTYTVGSDFDRTGLEVSKVYDNGDREPLDETQYTLDTSAYSGAQTGTCDIRIIPADSALAPIVLKVTVREADAQPWKTIIFGQSTSSSKNSVTESGDKQSVRLVALEGAGKVTGDHDGISFYYKELDAAQDNFVLSADIQVEAYAKDPHDGQESFGIMARDAIGTNGNSAVFASNIAAIGGFSGGTKEANGTQLFVRTGVQSSDGAGSKGVQKIMLDSEKPGPSNTAPVKNYRLTLAKTNSGFVGQLNDGEKRMFFEPDILNVQDSKMYVGFYTARLATITVSNIDLQVTAAATDAPKVEAPKVATTPDFSVLSLERTSNPDYRLRLKANVSGTATVKLGETVLAQDAPVQAGVELAVPAALAASGANHFSLAFLPNDDQFLTSYDKLVKNFTVTTKSYVPNGNIFVSPTGTSAGTGTAEQPLDLDTAIDYVRAGQKIILLGGTYVRSSMVNIKKYNDGTAAAKKVLEAAPGTRPVIDFDKKSEGVVLSGSYWHVKGIDVTRSAGNTKGFTVGGSYNIVELVNTYENGDTGLQISRTDDSEDKTLWPSYNLILNCTSYDNRDPSDNNADGFAAKLTAGYGNIFRGAISHNNIDDGWDLYTKSGSGAIGPVLIENSIAYNNGFLTNGTVGKGDKNGFKLGGEGIHVPHIIRGSIAFGNGAYGFASNSNPGVIAENNIAFDNARGNMNFTTYSHITPDFRIDGFISYQKSYTAEDNYPAALASKTNFMFDGTQSANAAGEVLTDANFASLTPVTSYERDANGDIIRGDFLKYLPSRPAPSPDSDSGDSTDTPAPSTPAPANSGAAPSGAKPHAANNDGSVTLQPATTTAAGTVRAEIDKSALDSAIAMTKAGEDGKRTVRIEVPGAQTAAGGYEIVLPASVYKAGSADLQLELKTGAATIRMPGHMFTSSELVGAESVALTVREVEPAAPFKERLGSSPVYEFHVRVDGEQINWSNTDAPVQVAIPYTPSANETNPEFIVVWFLAPSGEIVPVTSGKYSKEDGKVYFTTDHFSQYAVTYHHKTFADASSHWAKAQIDVMASKGIIQGVSDTAFMPSEHITRADFTLLLVRALGLTAQADQSFPDVTPADYFYKEVIVAKKLGLVDGMDNGRFDPRESITRQDMMVIAARALRAAHYAGLKDAAEGTELDGFTDKAAIAGYAKQELAAMVKAGLIEGDAQNRVNPTAATTRAEAAALIYRLYNR